MNGIPMVLGVDPGGTTGLALVSYVDGAFTLEAVTETTKLHVIAYVLDRAAHRVHIVAAERFVIGRRAGRSSSAAAGTLARDVLGVVAAEGKRLGGVRVKLRTAAEMKRWATDKRLKAAGLWEGTAATINHHDGRDAARHALMALVWDLGCPDPLSSSYRPGGRDGSATRDVP